MEITLGLVFQADWDDRPFRVLAFDESEVFYDCWWPHANAWGLASVKGRAVYYRVPTDVTRRRGKPLRTEPLTAEELAVHRPDLPLRLARSTTLQWTRQLYPSLESYAAYVRECSPSSLPRAMKGGLPIPKVFLYPFGPKGSSKTGTLIEGANGGGFSMLELLWRAHNLQAPLIRKPQSDGVGLYRSGFQRGVPSFYIWGATDRAALARAETDL